MPFLSIMGAFRVILFITMFFFSCEKLFAQEFKPGLHSEVSRNDIEKWKNDVRKKQGFDYYSSILKFPAGNISNALWNEYVLKDITKQDPQLKKAIAFVIGDRKLFPPESIKALLALLRDPSDSVVTVTTFSLAAFGEKAIRPLLALMQANPKPYLSNYTTEPYEQAIKSEWMEPDFFYSRDAARALYCIKLIGDTVLNFLPYYPGIKDYYKSYILHGINITEKNFPLYYKQVIGLKKSFEDYEPNFLYNEFIIKKLQASFSKEEAEKLLLSVDKALVPLLNQGNNEEESVTAGFNVRELIEETKQLDTISDGSMDQMPLLSRINRLSLKKDSFYLYHDTIAAVLKMSEKNESFINFRLLKPLLVLIANIGDSAQSLYPSLLPFTKHKDKDIRYLAIKAILNIHMNSNGSFTFLPQKLLLPTGEFYDAIGEYLRVSDELREGIGFPSPSYNRNWELRKSLGENYPIAKIHLNSELEIVNTNLRSLDLKNSNIQQLLRSFAQDSDERVRLYIANVLGLSDTLPPSALQSLIYLLKDSINKVSIAACLSATRYKIDNPDINRFVTAYLLEDYFFQRLGEEEHLVYDLDHPPFVYEKGGVPAIAMPKFPYAPPKPSSSGMIQLKQNTTNIKLGEVFMTLRKDLMQSGISDLKAFSFQDGFALLTRLERIKEDGTVDQSNRWSRSRIKPHGFSEYMYQLFMGQKGYFRSATILICGHPNLPPYSNELINASSYDELFEKGSNQLSIDLSSKPFTNMFIHFLVYEFSKGTDGVITFNRQSQALPLFSHFKSLKLNSFKLN